jgi:hypothetical protein
MLVHFTSFSYMSDLVPTSPLHFFSSPHTRLRATLKYVIDQYTCSENVQDPNIHILSFTKAHSYYAVSAFFGAMNNVDLGRLGNMQISAAFCTVSPLGIYWEYAEMDRAELMSLLRRQFGSGIQ